jgi:formate dehydrogenase iron-sulfur subunit
MASREKQLSALLQTSDPPRSRLSGLVQSLLYPFLHAEPPDPHTPTGFYTDTTVCIGCKACEVACKEWNQLPADGFNWSGNSYDNTTQLSATSWRHVKFIEQFSGVSSSNSVLLNILPNDSNPNRWLMMSDHCKHCLAAPCHQACPTGAIIHNEFQNVYIQADICNGCSCCVASCPFGVITRSSMGGHSHKCTLCYDRQRDGLDPPVLRRVRPSPSTSAPSTNCASKPVNASKNCTGAAYRRLTSMGTPPAKLTPSCIRSICLWIAPPFMACRMLRSIPGCT